MAPRVFTAYACPTSVPTRGTPRVATATAHGEVAPMSSVGGRSDVALTATWTKAAEPDHRRATRKSSGMRSKIRRIVMNKGPIAAWGAAKRAGEAVFEPTRQDSRGLRPGVRRERAR